tara:strand:- start:8093 stop:8476 length:384 start_codon:yes stop_codon:yes gene_type:complete
MSNHDFIGTNEELVMGSSFFNKISTGGLNETKTAIIYDKHKKANITFMYKPNSGNPYFELDFNNSNPSIIIDCEDEYERITGKNNKITEIYKGIVRGVGTRMWVTPKDNSIILSDIKTGGVIKLSNE